MMIRSIVWLLALHVAALVSPAARAQVQQPVPATDWRSFENPQSHTTIEYPAAIFVPAGPSERGTGERFQSRDRGATLSVYSQPNRTSETPLSYLQKNLKVTPSTIEYKRITRTFFALSTESGGAVYYTRCNFSAGSPGALHCFELSYPQHEKAAWDGIVTRMSLSLRPLER